MGAPDCFFNERVLGVSADSGGQQVIEFGQEEKISPIRTLAALR